MRLQPHNDEELLVVCAEQHRFLTAEHIQASGISNASIMLEPVARNTAPAIAAAAWHTVQKDKDGVMVVMPADHKIDDNTAFAAAIDAAVEAASENLLVTLGIKPTRAETGYGYICVQHSADNVALNTVSEFVEKPDVHLARKLIENGNCLWNAGVFIVKAAHFLDILHGLDPAMHERTRQAVANAKEDLDFIRLDAESFEQCEDISVDYAVLEKADKVAVIAYDSGWSDIGSWASVHRAAAQDDHGNVAVGDVYLDGCENSYVHAEDRLIVAKGLKNVAVVETSDAVIVMDAEQSQGIKDAIKPLQDEHRTELSTHKTCYRPWGHYTSLNIDARFQVKRITVKPGAKLSLQKHFHRSEHWVVVSGTAIVTRGEEEIMLSENESIYIPLGAMHRLYNPGTIPLDLIEVQSGAYLGEDDIVRIGDEYGRS